MLLGLKRLKNWLRMVILSDLMGNKNPELYVMALNRAKLLEELANDGQLPHDNAETMFLFGLLSLIEPMLDTPIEKLLDKLPIADEIKVGYIDPNSKYNKLLQLLAALEKSAPDDINRLCNELKIVEQSLADVSLRSIIWANDMHRYIL
jgi:EAL and modified HD-GYP domain-containing signal transduction protein